MTKRKLLVDEVRSLPKEIIELFDGFEKAGFELYLVGRAVKNLMSGSEIDDGDFTTNATPEQVMELLSDKKPVYENEFGTVLVPVKKDTVYEITTYRSEAGYSDHRKPDQVTWGQSLEEDVKRRDFTINAVVIGKKKRVKNEYELIDLVGGVDDFGAGIIRTVGDANERFGEDALRMMRAIRFASVLGFEIEKKTLEAIAVQAPLLKEISRERVRDELFKILGSRYPSDGVRLLISTGLMKNIIPEILEAKNVDQKGHHKLDVLEHMLESLKHCPSSDRLVRLAALIHDVGKPVSKRWRCGDCGWVMKEKNLVKEDGLKCPRCGREQTKREATTFYGHEVVGARMALAIGERLRLSRKQIEKLVMLVRWHMFAYQKEMTDAAIRRIIRRVGKENINDMILLRIGDRKGGGSKTTSWRLDELQKRIGEQLYEPMEVRDLAINGKDVMRILKITPGPKIGEVLNKLFEEVIDDTSKNNKEYLEKRVKELA